MFLGLAITGTFIASAHLAVHQNAVGDGPRAAAHPAQRAHGGLRRGQRRFARDRISAALDREIVVVEVSPRPETVEASRDRHFDLLTGRRHAGLHDRTVQHQHAVALVAITENDTMNLEVALGARGPQSQIYKW